MALTKVVAQVALLSMVSLAAAQYKQEYKQSGHAESYASVNQLSTIKHEAPLYKHEPIYIKHEAPAIKHEPIYIKHEEPAPKHEHIYIKHEVPAPKHEHIYIKHEAPIKHEPVYVKHEPVYKHEEPHAHPKYSFKYGVEDKHTGDIKDQAEERDGDVVKGEYSLLQPDGRKRIVHYTSSKHGGFHALVSYSGHAIHPEVKKIEYSHQSSY